MTLRSKFSLLGAAAVGLMAAGCHTDMWVQPKHHHPYQESDLFADGNSSRPLPEGVVIHGNAKLDDAKYTGRENGKLVNRLPDTLVLHRETVDTRKDLLKVIERGKERYNIFCSHCHGATGDGKGMIALRGLSLKRPPGNFHTDRLREMELGHFYDVITKGYGVMYPQASRVKPDDRWAIVAYIRALQMSQNMDAATLSPEELSKVEASSNMAPSAKPSGATK